MDETPQPAKAAKPTQPAPRKPPLPPTPPAPAPEELPGNCDRFEFEEVFLLGSELAAECNRRGALGWRPVHFAKSNQASKSGKTPAKIVGGHTVLFERRYYNESVG